MSKRNKREAQDYITKEHGTTPNDDRAPEPKRMATAAQLARRKLATPRGRLNQTSRSQTPTSNVFGSAQPQQQSGSMSVNGFQFGGNHDNSSFTFQGQSTDSNNPFMTGSAWGSTPNQTFQGNTDNEQEMTTDSPEKKMNQPFIFGQPPPSQPQFTMGMNGNNSSQQQSGGLFGSTSNANTASQQNGGLFGSSQQSSQQGGGLFGAVAPASTAQSGSVFGQITPQPSLGLFGSQQSSRQSSQEPQTNNPFGQVQQQQSGGLFNFKPQETQQASMFGQTQSAPSSFSGDQQQRQSSFGDLTPADQRPQSQSQSFGAFGQSASPQPAQASLFSQPSPPKQQQDRPASPFSFGQPAQQAQSPQPADNTQDASQSQSKPIFSFGQTSGNTQSSTLFNPPSSTAQSANTPSLFSGFGSQKTESPQSNGPLFGQTPSKPVSAESTTPKTPFVFGQSSNTQSSQASTSRQPEEPPKHPFASLFNQNTNVQSQSAVTESQATSTPAFSFPPAPSPSAMTTGDSHNSTTSTSNLFGAPKPTASSSHFSNPFGGVQKQTVEPSDTSAQNTQTSAAAFQPAMSSTSVQAPASGSIFSSVTPMAAGISQAPFTPVAKSTNIEVAQTEPPKAQGSGIFSAAQQTPQTEKPKKRLFGQTLDRNTNTNAALAMPAQPAPSTTKAVTSEKAINTVSSSRIPGYINAEGYKEFDNNARLRSLNRQFKDAITAADTETQDMDSIIRYYVAARESVGSDIGLYQRTLAGTKRKTTSDDELDVPPQYKKSRADETGNATLVASEPAAKPATTQAPAPSASFTSTPVPAPSSRATSVFSNLIPKSPQKKPASQPENNSEKPVSVFASVPSAPTSANNPFGNVFKQNQPSTPQPAPKTSNVFGQGPATAPPKATQLFGQSSTTPVKSPPKKPVFGFQASASASDSGDGFAAFAKAAAAGKKKRTAEQMLDYDSDEESQAEGRKELEEQERAKKAKYESVAKTGFMPAAMPGSSSQKPAFSFGQSEPVSTTHASPLKRRTSGPFESSSESSSEGEDDQNDEANEAKDGEFQPSEDDEEGSSEDAEGDEEHGGSSRASANGETSNDEDANADHSEEIAMNPNAGKSLFDRITPGLTSVSKSIEPNDGEQDSTAAMGQTNSDPIRNSTSKNPAFKPAVWGSEIGQGTPEAPSFTPFGNSKSPFKPAVSGSENGQGTPDAPSFTPFGNSKSPFKPASTFNFTPTPPTTTPTPALGGSVLFGAPAGAGASKFEGMFGSRPSTPDPSTHEANAATSTPADQTWKVGTPIKFGAPGKSPDAPAINITDASPSHAADTPKPLGNLFGTPSTLTGGSSSNVGFGFGSKPAPGFLVAASHLQAGSGLSSALSSRATSPGLTDNESIATTDNEAEAQQDEQASLMMSRAGEENEDCLLEMKSKALKFINSQDAKDTKDKPNEWNSVGTGMLRVLKNKETGKTRVVFRLEPSANILVNQNLLRDFKWETLDQGKNAAVKGAFVLPQGKGTTKLQRWVFKVKNMEKAEELRSVLEARRLAN